MFKICVVKYVHFYIIGLAINSVYCIQYFNRLTVLSKVRASSFYPIHIMKNWACCLIRSCILPFRKCIRVAPIDNMTSD